MISRYRGWILPGIVLVILLSTVPTAIHRLIQTGDPYLFTERFFEDMVARLSGPGRFRFILQPLVAIMLGTRDGVKDARVGSCRFLWGLIFRKELRPHCCGTALHLCAI